MPIDFNQLRQFLEAIAETKITDLAIKEGDFELTVHKESAAPVQDALSPPTPAVAAVPAKPAPTAEVVTAQVPETAPAAPETSSPSKPDGWVEITSPMVGTFYRAPAPGESPFVELGDRIDKGQVVCIIEAMKLMNEIESEVAGKVVEILGQNGEPVEYGQTLMWIDPS